MFPEPHGQRSACFANVASATFTGNAIDTMGRLLRISLRSGVHKSVPKSVFSSEDCPNIILITYPFKLFRNTLHIWNIYRTQRFSLFRTTTSLGINDRVNEAFGITVQLKIVPQVVNFFEKMLSVLAYGGGSVMETFY